MTLEEIANHLEKMINTHSELAKELEEDNCPVSAAYSTGMAVGLHWALEYLEDYMTITEGK